MPGDSSTPGTTLLFRQSVSSIDQAPYQLPGLRRMQVLALLDPLRLVCQVLVLDRPAKPARVVPPAQVEHPGFLIDTFGDLRKNDKVLGLEVLAAPRPAKVETVIAHIAFGVLAAVPQPLGAAGGSAHGE